MPNTAAAPQVQTDNQSQVGHAIFLRVALLATGLAYLPTIGFGFVYDDVLQICMNESIQSWSNLPLWFSKQVWAFLNVNMAGAYYRPMFLTWLAANYTLFGFVPGWWHLATIAAHVVATALVYQVANRLLRDRWMAAVAALLFGVNPAHIECVAWISGVPEVLLACWVLGSLLMFVHWREHRRIYALLASLAMYAVALLTKETALALVVILPVFSWACTEESFSLRRAVRQVSPYLALSIAYLVLRKVLLGGIAETFSHRSWTSIVMTWPAAVWFYIRHMAWPFGLSSFYDLEIVRAFSIRGVLWPAVAAAAVIGGMVWLGRRRRVVMLSVVWITACLPPALLGIRVFQAHDYVHDRYTYLPSVMVAILLTMGLRKIAGPSPKRLLAVAGPIAAVLIVGTLIQSRPWREDLSLFTDAREKAPLNPLPADNRARTLVSLGRPEEAVAEFREVLKRNPEYLPGYYVLGLTLYQMKRWEEAEPYLARAAEMSLSSRPEPSAFYYLALTRYNRGNYSGAEDALRDALRARPDGPGYHRALAAALTRLGRDTEAAKEMELERKRSAER